MFFLNSAPLYINNTILSLNQHFCINVLVNISWTQIFEENNNKRLSETI